MKRKLKLIGLSFVCLLSTNIYANTQESKIVKIKPVPVKNIKYNKGLFAYSHFKPTKEELKKYTKDQNIAPFRLKGLYNRTDNPTSIVVSAFAYDYAFKRPDLAENFYALFPKHQLSLSNKIKHADFLLRTGRPNMISSIITKRDCLKSFKYRSQCYYYLGLEEYFASGNHKNNFFNLSRDNIENAEKIYKNGIL